MAKKKQNEEDIGLRRELTEIHVTLGMIRAAVDMLEKAVQSKDKEAFRDALAKIKVYIR